MQYKASVYLPEINKLLGSIFVGSSCFIYNTEYVNGLVYVIFIFFFVSNLGLVKGIYAVQRYINLITYRAVFMLCYHD